MSSQHADTAKQCLDFWGKINVMQAVEATVDVDAQGHLTFVVLEPLPPGHHRALVMLAEDVRQPIIDPDSPLPGLVIKGGIWPEGYTASRSQLYGYDDDDA